MRIPVDIRIDDLSGQEIASLLQEHLRNMALHSPPESIHALDLAALRKPEITFWTVWQGPELMGCGAIKELDSRHGEIKSMRTSSGHLRKGVAAGLMRHMLKEAGRRRYRRLSLETGSMEAFAPARSLYAGFGFRFCGPFADYVEDPYSVFMTRALGSMAMDAEIQRAGVADAHSILALQRLAYESEARIYNDWSIPPLIQTLDQVIEELAASHFLKATLEGALIGSVRARLVGGSCEIGRLIVHPDFQRRGLGGLLMTAIEQAFPAADRYELFTGSLSEGNIRLYQSLGYRRTRLHEVSARLTLVYMEKHR